MIKMLAFVFAFLPSLVGHQPLPESATCTCASVTNVQKAFQSSGAINYTWSAVSGATQYKVWYTRHSDGYISGFSYTTSTAYAFTGLAAGQYTFHFVAVCGGEGSNLIGVQDVLL